MSRSDSPSNITILGMHRSGTSMVAGALHACGFYCGQPGELMVSREDNPCGFFERVDVVKLNDEVLENASGNWFSPTEVTTATHSRVNEKIADILSKLGAGKPWLIKDPRLAITWPLWRSALADSIKVYVYRPAVAVAQSLQRRNGFPMEFGLALWEYYNRRLLLELSGSPFVAVSFQALSSDPNRELAALMDRLSLAGASLEGKPVAALFRPELDHSREAHPDHALLMSPAQVELERVGTAVCEEGMVDRVITLPAAHSTRNARLRDQARAYAALAEARQVAEQLATVTRQHDKIYAQYLSLSTDHRALQSRNSQLAHKLSTNCHRLRSFNHSLPGRLTHAIVTLYKWLTLRPQQNTAFDDLLADAREHFAVYGTSESGRRPSRLRLLIAVVRYLAANPAASIRSFSLARLKRGLSVLLRSDREALHVWVGQRFPASAVGSYAELEPELTEDLDTLNLKFPAKDLPRVSIVMPVYNQYRMTMYCLRSLLENTRNVPYEIILADDASSDLTATIAARVHNVRVLRAQKNCGFIVNCNSAAELARGETILFLNNDTGLTPGWLETLINTLESDAEIGIVGPKLLFGNGRLQEAGGIVWSDASGWNYGRMDDPTKPQYNYLRDTDYVSGACLLIRKHLWRQLGGFDPRYQPAYYEDADLAFSARKAGFRVVYQPAAAIYHFEGISNGTDVSAGVKRYQIDNQEKFHAKWQLELKRNHFANAEHLFLARDRSKGKRCILVIDHYVPSYDKDAGSRSTWLYLKLLTESGYNVKFIGANFFPHEPYTGELQQMGIEVLVGEHIARRLEEWLRESAPYVQAIYLHRPHVAEQFLPLLEKLDHGAKRLFFGHDLHYLRKQRELELTNDEKVAREAEDWRRREYAIFDRLDQIYYPSQVEVDEILAKQPRLPVKAIPLYAIEDAETPAYHAAERSGLLFVGGFNHPPNADAIHWFVGAVLPLLRQRFPEIHLHIVGSNPTPDITALNRHGITVHGFLTDAELMELYEKVSAAIVPLRFGAGVKGKVIEALQRGLPLVTTSTGAEGLPEAESVMHIADTEESFADAIAAALEFNAVAAEKVSHYADYLSAHFSGSKVRDIIERDFGPPRLEVT